MLGHNQHVSETPFYDDGPLLVDPPSPYQLKNIVKVGPPLTKLSGSVHVY